MTMTNDLQLDFRQIVMEDDTARVRESDPETSHLAAEKSARGLSKLRTAVLQVIESFDFNPTGSDVNRRYAAWSKSDPKRYPIAHPDSPRKRCGELADDGYLDVVGTRIGHFNSPESIYALSPDGRALLATVPHE